MNTQEKATYEKILSWQGLSIENQVKFYFENQFYLRLVPVFSEYLLFEKHKDSDLISSVWDYVIPIVTNKKVSFIAKLYLNVLDECKNNIHLEYVKESLREAFKSSLGKDYDLISQNLVYDEFYTSLLDENIEYLLKQYARHIVAQS
jgi:hypothetical protein